MNWLLAVLIACLVYIGIDYGRLIAKRRGGRKRSMPSSFVFYDAGSDYMSTLVQHGLRSHEEGGDPLIFRHIDKIKGIEKYVYKSGDELIVYREGAPITAMTRDEIESRMHYIFVDYKLPGEAICALIEKLGLRNYAFKFGICDENGGKRNGNNEN